jgi:hypothetical protein
MVTNVNGIVTAAFLVMAGLVPAIPMSKAPPCRWNRDRRDKPGDADGRGYSPPFAPILAGINKIIDGVVFWMLRQQLALSA